MPPTWEELIATFDGLVADLLPAGRCAEAVAATRDLEHRSVRSFGEFLSVPSIP